MKDHKAQTLSEMNIVVKSRCINMPNRIVDNSYRSLTEHYTAVEDKLFY